MTNINIAINIENKNWLQYDKNIVNNLTKFLQEISLKTKIKDLIAKNINIEISLLLTDNKKIQSLNKRYRHKDMATNILAFPLHNIKLNKTLNIKNSLFDNNLILGDLILSLEFLKNEAKKQNKLIKNHLKHLLLHGLLHLIGYDHLNDNDAKIMEKIEIEILQEFAIKNPYID